MASESDFWKSDHALFVSVLLQLERDSSIDEDQFDQSMVVKSCVSKNLSLTYGSKS